MLRIRHTLSALAVLATLGGVAEAEEVTAYLGRTVKPNAQQNISFSLWGHTGIEISEYKLTTSELEGALRQGNLKIDVDTLTAARTVTHTGHRGDIQIASRAGVYLYVARPQAGSVGTSTRIQAQAVVVSSLSMAIKRDNDSSLILINRGTRPVRHARIKVFEVERDSAPTVLRTYRARGGAVFLRTQSTKNLIYVARVNGHVAIHQGWDRTWQANASSFQVHAQTDRPLYRPGQTVHYKAVLREKTSNGAHRTPVDEEVRIFLRDSQGTRTRLATKKTSRFGTVAGSTLIAESANLGNHTIEIEAGQHTGTNPAPVLARAAFGVEAYRKPEYKVEVSAAKTSYVQGETVNATVQADYYFGAPVPNAQVSYTVKKRTRWRWWHPWMPPIVMRSMSPMIWWPRYNDQVVSRGTATTNSSGAATISFQSTQDTFDADYEITAKVVDASNREVSGSAKVPVTRASVDIKVITDRYVYQPGDLVRLRVNTANIDGSAAPGVSVELKVEALKDDGTREHRFTRTRTTDADGEAGLNLRARTQNRYVVTATATDANGNTVSAEHTLWVADERGGKDWNWNSVEIVNDKDVYAVGDTAYLLVKAPVLTGRGVVTVEGEDIQQAYTFNIIGGVALVDIPVRAAMAPNAFVTVLVPTADGWKTASKELQVPPVDKLVNVEVTADKSEYKPGDSATFTIKATDHNGRPVRAEIALGIVDEALYALREDQTANMVDAFYPRTYNQVHTIGAIGGGGWRGGPGGPFLPFTLEATRHTAAAPNAGGGDQGGVREYFPDTMRWIATVQTDARGEATISQTMADSLTTWRLTARAVTEATEVGETKTTTLVRKDLIVRLAAPRTLVEGDELELTAIVHNLAKEGTPGASNASVRLRLQANGVTLVGGASHTVNVDRNAQAKVTFKVRVDSVKQATLTLRGTASFENDALRLTLPVAARGVSMPRVASGSKMQDGDVTLTLDKHANTIDGMSELKISLSPSLSGTMLDSLEYLVGYPYGCVEQTMSRFLPTLVVAETLKTLGREDSNLKNELPKMVKKGIELIKGHQNSDGGFGWFGGRGNSHPYVSAYVTYGLAIAKNQGYDVPSDLMTKATDYLKKSLTDATNTDLNGRAYQVYALAEAGVYETAEMTSLAGQKSQLDNYAKAVLAMSLKKASQSSMANDVIADLTASAVTVSGKTHWPGNTLRYGNWTSNTIETSAYVVRAFLELDPQNPLVAQGMSWILSRRQRFGRWNTTKDSAAVVLTLAKFVVVTNELRPNLSVTVTVNGRQVDTAQFDPSSLSKKAHVVTVSAGVLNTGPNTITISRHGQGALYYTATLDQKVRMNPIGAADNGIQVTREYFLVTETLDATTGRITETETALAGNHSVKIGDKVRVRISMSVSHQGDVEHVNLEDRFPVGFEVVQQNQRHPWSWWSYWRTAKEVHDDKVVFFATRLPWRIPAGGPTSYAYSYDMRPEVAGSLMALPSFAEAVYAPETNGRTAGTLFTVSSN